MTTFISPILGHLFTVLIFLLSLLFVSFILRSKRPPGSTLAWLMFIMIIPYLGIPFYLLLAGRKFPSRKRLKTPLYTPAATPRGPGTGDGVEWMLDNLGMPPSRAGQEARLITSGEGAHARITEMIQTARQDTHLTTFIFKNDAVGKHFLRLLEQKAAEGVAVRILLDSFGSLMASHPSFEGLRQKGGQVSYFNPVFHLPFRGRANLRNHRKLLVVDSQRALLGGMNIGVEYLGPDPDPQRWIDLCLEIKGQAVSDLQVVFHQDWAFSMGGEKPAPPPPTPAAEGDTELRTIASGPDVKSDSLYDILISLIFQATQRVWIATPYFIPDESLTKALELAGRRGIDVRVLVPGRSNHWLADLARGTYLRQLLRAGGRVNFTDRMMHAKAFMVDGTYTLLGSANFDMRSLLLNFEIGALIRSGGPVRELESWFLNLFEASTPAPEREGYWRDLAEGLGRVLGPMI
jgi:cardiolipin synthase A/B